MFKRSLTLPEPGTDTFFLWGPRQTGKTTLLRQAFPNCRWIDLLKSDVFIRYATRPELLRLEADEQAARPDQQIVVDEIQKVPALLDEIHWLMENRGLHFALCGSSARKVRRGAANLLGGRALRYELRGLTAEELGDAFDLDRILNRGYLPRIYGSSRYRKLLDSYVSDYLKQEILAEGLVRSLPVFSDFLEAAALSEGSFVNFSNIARECGVSTPTVKSYFGILEDTLIGCWLPAYRKRVKRRVIGAPKFYFADVGLVNQLSKRGVLERGSALYGKAFENWVFHELSSYISYRDRDLGLSHWRLPSGIEVDFVVGAMQVAIEAKAAKKITSHHLKGLRTLSEEHPGVGRRIVVCLESQAWRTKDGISVLPASTFAQRLWRGELL